MKITGELLKANKPLKKALNSVGNDIYKEKLEAQGRWNPRNPNDPFQSLGLEHQQFIEKFKQDVIEGRCAPEQIQKILDRYAASPLVGTDHNERVSEALAKQDQERAEAERLQSIAKKLDSRVIDGYRVSLAGNYIQIHGVFTDEIHSRIKRAGGYWERSIKGWQIHIEKAEVVEKTIKNAAKAVEKRKLSESQANQSRQAEIKKQSVPQSRQPQSVPLSPVIEPTRNPVHPAPLQSDKITWWWHSNSSMDAQPQEGEVVRRKGLIVKILNVKWSRDESDELECKATARPATAEEQAAFEKEENYWKEKIAADAAVSALTRRIKEMGKAGNDWAGEPYLAEGSIYGGTKFLVGAEKVWRVVRYSDGQEIGSWIPRMDEDVELLKKAARLEKGQK